MEKTIQELNTAFEQNRRPLIVKNGQHCGYMGAEE